MSSGDTERLLTIAEVCELLQVDERTVYKWRQAGIVDSVKVGGIVRIPFKGNRPVPPDRP